MFSTLCTVTADTRQMANLLQPHYGMNGVLYYRLDYKVVLLFGLTELKAQISWMENVSVIFIAPDFTYSADHLLTRA